MTFDDMDIPEESMRHIEALLARHPPQLIQRMFSQAIDSRRNSIPSSFMSTSTTSSSATSASGSSWRSRMSVASTFSTASANSDYASSLAPSVASSSSSKSRVRRAEPRSYPASLDPPRHGTSTLNPSLEVSSPLELKSEPNFGGSDDAGDASSFADDKSAVLSGEPYMFCTYCAEQRSQRTFKAKSDWKKHEMRMHETGEDWPCIVLGCNRIFDRQKDFIKHHQRYHSGRPLPSLTDIGITLLPRRVFGCGFNKCKEVSIGWDERCDHVAKHMKNGATYDQWKYSNVIRNLIRQEALHDTWKELLNCLDERLRESRLHISWCPDNSRILRQKLQCCDLRPSREEVLVTALSLRSDIPLDSLYQQPPAGFVTPSRDSVPNVDKMTREQRMQILIGHSNIQLCHTRLASINSALLRNSNGVSALSEYDYKDSSYMEPQSPVADTSARRISYMDVDPGDYLDVAQPAIPDPTQVVTTSSMSLPHSLAPSIMSNEPAQASVREADFAEPQKPTANPLGWCYPSYFDAAPQFEESQYYERPSLGQMSSKPFNKIGSRLGASRDNSSTHSRASSISQHQDVDYTIPNAGLNIGMRPPQHSAQQMSPHHQQYSVPTHDMQSSYRHSAQMHDMHMYAS